MLWESPYSRSIPISREPWSLQKSLNHLNKEGHHGWTKNETMDNRIFLDCTKSFTQALRHSLFLSFHIIHIRARDQLQCRGSSLPSSETPTKQNLLYCVRHFENSKPPTTDALYLLPSLWLAAFSSFFRTSGGRGYLIVRREAISHLLSSIYNSTCLPKWSSSS